MNILQKLEEDPVNSKININVSLSKQLYVKIDGFELQCGNDICEVFSVFIP